MRPKHRQYLSYVLLATYASISILGDGLHSLLPADEHHHHHHGLYVISHSYGDAEQAAHGHDAVSGAGSGYAELSASKCDADSHLCEICAFLYEAISQPAEIAAPIDWQPLVVVAHAEPQPVYSLTALGCPAARGPPLFLA
jgi:hypothetical protein